MPQVIRPKIENLRDYTNWVLKKSQANKTKKDYEKIYPKKCMVIQTWKSKEGSIRNPLNSYKI